MSANFLDLEDEEKRRAEVGGETGQMDFQLFGLFFDIVHAPVMASTETISTATGFWDQNGKGPSLLISQFPTEQA